MLCLPRPVKGRKGEGAQLGSGVTEAGRGASAVPKFAGLTWSGKRGGEVTQAASLPSRPAVPPGPDSSHPAAPFLLEQCFPACSENEKAGACQGALEDGLHRGTAVGSCCRWQPDELQVNPQLHPVWSYERGFVPMATAWVPKRAAGRGEVICSSLHSLV